MRKLYTFLCEQCGWRQAEYGTEINIGDKYTGGTCDLCDGPLYRTVSFSYHKPLQPHYNNSVGKYVSGQRDFRDELKRQSDTMSLKTGMTHNYQPIDLREKDALGVTDEGLYETNKHRRDTGIDTATKRIIT